MTSTAGKYVWAVVAAVISYSLVIAVGLLTGLIRLQATPLCIALPCFAVCLWYTNAYLESRSLRSGWGLLVNAAGWGLVSLAFLVPPGWHVPFSAVAAVLIALGGIAGWLSLRDQRQQPGTR